MRSNQKSGSNWTGLDVAAGSLETLAAPLVPAWRPVDHGRIPSLDGLRAISILFVILGHAANTLPRPGGAAGSLLHGLTLIFGNGEMGVTLLPDTRYLDGGRRVESPALLNKHVFVRAGRDVWGDLEAYRVMWGEIVAPE